MAADPPERPDERVLVIGPSRSRLLLEIVCIPSDTEHRLIHSMKLRPSTRADFYDHSSTRNDATERPEANGDYLADADGYLYKPTGEPDILDGQHATIQVIEAEADEYERGNFRRAADRAE
mgnify:CR=1 FL=1